MRYILLFCLLMQSMFVFAHRNCGTETLHQINLEKDPSLRAKELEIENFTRKFLEKNASSKLALENEIIIPVVFHVVYFTTGQNINDTRIREQIDVLNNDFNALNSDINKVPTPFQSAIGKFKVKFVLANRDPNGNVTNGINRVKTTKSAAFDINKDDVKSSFTLGANAWDTKSYLNIWVCNIKDYDEGGIELLGYATFPSNAGTNVDGVVLNSKYVGVSGATRPFNLGRTATHEVGHYFNLFHIWGDRDNCSATDFVGDTPNQYTASGGNPTFPKTDNCSNSYPGIMFMNYMDYCSDASLYMFTKGQVSRMEATMNGPRASLLKSTGYANDYDIAASKINTPNSDFLCDNSFTPSLKVVSNGTSPVTSFNVDFIVNNVVNQTARWTGNIGYLEAVNIVFNPVAIENGFYNVAFKVYNSNGADSDSNNDNIFTNIKVDSDRKSLPFNESFESSNISSNGFTIVNSDNGLTWARSSINASTVGNYSIFMNNFDYDPEEFSGNIGVFDDIIFPFIDMSDYSQATMTFDLAACQFTSTNITDNNWDSLQVLVSIDCGESFKVIYNKFAASLITVPKSEAFFTPTSASQWRNETIDLSDYAGRENVLLKIRNISNFENNIYIDNLKINGNTVTSIKDAISDVSIQLYPNPSKGVVFVKIDQKISSLKRIEWINTLGQRIEVPNISSLSNNMQFDFSQQPKGVYIANFIFNDGTVSNKKLILN